MASNDWPIVQNLYLFLELGNISSRTCHDLSFYHSIYSHTFKYLIYISKCYSSTRPPFPRSRDSHDQETFLAPSADKHTLSYDIECWNHHPSLSTLRSKELNRSKMKRWAIYRNLPVNVIDYPILGAEIARVRKRF